MILIVIYLLISCEKKSFPPSITGKPVIFFKADFDSIPYDFTINDSLKTENQFVIDDTIRHFVIHMEDASGLESIRIVFNNYNSGFNDYAIDLDSTIKAGSKKYVEFIPPPYNPLQVNRVSIEYQNAAGYSYSTIPVISQNGFFNIDSVYQKRWEDGRLYKIFRSSFECKMYNTYKADSIIVKNGAAKLAFEIN